MVPDYYSILGVSPSASEKEIKMAYRKLARKCHPDLSPGNKEAEARFREINEAYEALSDPQKRAKYDQYVKWSGAGGRGAPGRETFPGFSFHFEENTQPGGSAVGDLFSDFFQTLFGEGAARGPWSWAPSQRSSPSPEQLLDLTLEEAAFGAVKHVEIESSSPCKSCGGSRVIQTGRIRAVICGDCKGSGVTTERKRAEVKIPAGVQEGSKIRLAREGVIFSVSLRKHPIFEVRGKDLSCTIPVSLSEAMLGAQIEVPTLKGKASMKIPPETPEGRLFRLAGQGFPARDGSGDLYVKAHVVLPSVLTPREKELFRELAAQRSENPRHPMNLQ